MKFDVPMPVGLAIVGAGIYVFWRICQSKVDRINRMPDIPGIIPAGGFVVPILATFTALRGAPPQVNFAHNSLNPTFTLYEDRMECRVLMKRSIHYSAIEYIDIWDAVLTRNIYIHVKGSENVFVANLLNRRNLSRTLKFFEHHGVPLTRKAKKFVSVNPV